MPVYSRLPRVARGYRSFAYICVNDSQAFQPRPSRPFPGILRHTPRLPSMRVRRQEARLHIVSRRHDLVLLRPLCGHASRDGLCGSMICVSTQRSKCIVERPHLELHVVVRAKEQRDCISIDPISVDGAMHGGLEDVVCMGREGKGAPRRSAYTRTRKRLEADVLVQRASWSPRLQQGVSHPATTIA